MPSKIATFLQLEHPNNFTGHCFRRSSATLLVNRDGDLLSLKRHGAWKSSTVAEGYVAESFKRKIDVANLNVENKKLNSHIEIERENLNLGSTANIQANQLIPGLFSHTENCTINVNMYNNCVFKKE